MPGFTVVAVPTEVAEYVRANGKSPVYGFPAHKEIATGRAPCRHCLRLIRAQDEELLLFTYDPFQESGARPLPGPVYVHADECARYGEEETFPEAYRGRQLTFSAYGTERNLVKEILLANGEEESLASQLFAMQEVEYIHVRSTEAGCYLFRLERA
jgi:Protein of unknown function (DUF1203)